MQQSLETFIKKQKNNLEKTYTAKIESLDIPDSLKKSMLYSLDAGGKRLRPVLLMASNAIFEASEAKAISSAVALEMIHTYSLIHDDLPAMDDDDYRRGKQTNHKVFGEATATLAGDALVTYSFEIIAEDEQLTAEQRVKLLHELSRCSGPKGMVGGQILDMQAEDSAVSLEEMERIHELKTGELLRFAVFAGAYIGGATSEELRELEKFAYYLGLIFQVQDDILDIIGDEEKLGKPVGSDETNQKSTYPKLLGLDGAKKQKEIYVQKAKDALQTIDAGDSYLMQLVDYFSNRDH